MSRVHISLLFAVILWGWSFVATKVLLRYLSPVEVMGARLFLGVPPMILVLAVKRIRPRLPRRDWLLMGACSLVLIFHFQVQITGMQYTSATNTAWIIAVTPLAIVLLAVSLLGERLRRPQIFGVVAATLGVLVLVSRGNPSGLGGLANLGDWMVLASAFTWAAYTVLSRHIADGRQPLFVTTVVLAIAALLALSYMLVKTDWTVFWELPVEGWIATLFLGLFCISVTLWIWNEGVARIGASRAGFFLYLEPLFATSVAVPLLGDYFGWPTIFGGILIIGGVLLAERRVASVPSPRRSSH
jgi:drug/metabolite transporter (DMT)-like permease